MKTELTRDLGAEESERQVAPATIPPRKKGPGRAPLSRVPFWFAVPALVLYLAFSLGPNVAGTLFAFTDWDGLSGNYDFIGFENFETIWNTPALKSAFTHTLFLGFGYMVLVNVISAALAIGLNRQLKSRNFLRALFFAPVVVTPLAVTFVWQFILKPDGPLNSVLGSVGLSGLQELWLVDHALWSVLAVMVWQHIGLAMLLYLAGLQTIPDELYEASSLDGAGVWSQFRHITAPLLAPAVFINMTVTLIFGFRAFDQVLGLTGGGPGTDTETLATQVYKQAIVNGRLGLGAALALMLAVIISIFSVTQGVLLRRRVRAI